MSGYNHAMVRSLSLGLCLAVLVSAHDAFGVVCVNKFLRRSEGSKQVITLLTGKLTFEEAQKRAKGAPIEWVDDKGKVVAKSAELKVVRPMPVGCDGKTSGVVMIVTFLSPLQPKQKMVVKLDDSTTVTFDEQSE